MSVRDLIPWGRSENRVQVRSEPDPFLSFQREVNKLFDDFWHGFGVPSQGFGVSGGWPRVELVEHDDEIVVTAELPGLGEKDVELVLDGDILTLKGERKAEKDAERDGFVFSERFFGRFERRIVLPEEVDRDRVHASIKDGVLTVTMAKAETPQRRKRIPINGR
jgi:HSP20 family protein